MYMHTNMANIMYFAVQMMDIIQLFNAPVGTFQICQHIIIRCCGQPNSLSQARPPSEG